MAGGGNAEDNPVAINVVPIVDVIFCLCVFFMCSMKFKQLEGKFDSWLPKDQGISMGPRGTFQETRVALTWDFDRQKTRRQFGTRVVEDDVELERLLEGSHGDFVLANRASTPVIIDGDARVPWKDVVDVVNICKRLAIDNVEFALGSGEK